MAASFNPKLRSSSGQEPELVVIVNVFRYNILCDSILHLCNSHILATVMVNFVTDYCISLTVGDY
jgi:hypothetical protein